MSVAVPSAAPAAHTEIVVRPPRGWSGFGLAELWRYRELLYFLTKRELQVRYKQSVFGVAWAVLQPLTYAALFTVFARANKDIVPGVPYPVFALAAMVPWIFVAQSVGQSASSLVSDANLLTKVYFPRLLLPVARVLSFLVDLALALAILIVFVVLYGVPAVLGASAAAALPAPGRGDRARRRRAHGRAEREVPRRRRRDPAARPAVVLLDAPLIYLGTTFNGVWQYIYALNPIVTVIDGVRWGFLDTAAPDAGPAAVSTATALVLLFVGVVYFRRTERFFADVV